ncbi:GIY-YIG nuclease family protein [Pseudoclavibacter albus]|uniref:GIY-YIG nuclease family protein n=1 Tax=Pseudoclavibacter albus TaxID=272241 RepID=UPI000B2FD46D|nr:GIY-YIG nuclease family protein [Pseudoclavibacter alba]
MTDSVFRTVTYERFEVPDRSVLAPIMRDRGPGIYCLEFANGERYVGQTVNFTQRLGTHIHGSKHHEAWTDIVAVNIVECPRQSLDEMERYLIRRERETGHKLRNKTFNFGFVGPSNLDQVIPVIEQQHWATGHGSFDVNSIVEASRRRPGPPKLLQHAKTQQRLETGCTLGDAVIADLASAAANCIPNLVELEGEYWTMSDLPGTSGGRFATLNVGRVEFLFHPRRPIVWEWEDGTVTDIEWPAVLNLPPGFGAEILGLEPDGYEPGDEFGLDSNSISAVLALQSGKYRLTAVDQLIVPTGSVGQVMWELELLDRLRLFVLDIMRMGDASVWRRWHSKQLANRVYRSIAKAVSGDE